ncbi:MAG: DNA polymerase III subunit alpha, partial [Hyphomicrobiaceae bacterium]
MTAAIQKLNAKAQQREDARSAPAGGTAPAATATANIPYIHLKVHSAYSLLEGALPIGKIAKLADKLGYPAVGLTDTNNMFGALEFSDKIAGAGIQPIVGVTLALDFLDAKQSDGLPRGMRNEPQSKPAGQLALLASNDSGYANLMALASKAYLQCPDAEPTHIKIDALEVQGGGLIALTGGPDGPIDRAIRDGQMDLAEARLNTLSKIFGDRLYVEIQRHGLAHEAHVEPQLLELAYKLDLPIVATNEAYFAASDDYEAHDALICIAEGSYIVEDNRRRLSPEHGFKSPVEMAALFADLPEALANTLEIAKRCTFRPRGRKPILPRFVATVEGASEEDQLAAEAAEMKRQAEEGLAKRLTEIKLAPGFTVEDYQKRLAFEVDVITKMKFPGYFLIVADFIKWSKANGVPVGPGRGSGAGSLVAYSLTITDLDPLRFGLLFERFLNPERVSMPDFDIDFCQENREKTIHYVQQKYGTDRVAQIITHGKLQARAVLRDVGRVLQMPYGQVDRLCKLVPNNPAHPVTLPEAIEGEPKLQEERDNDPMVAKLLEISQKLEGLYRHASTHAAGMVIGDRPLDQLVPMYRDPKSNFPVTQFNWKLVEAAGLVKFDFLGLKTLTVLQKSVELIKRRRGIDVDLSKVAIDGDDPKVLAAYDLLAKADTVGVFQLESTGMRESLKKLKPDMFDDIIAMVSLYRPGPMDNIPTYIHRKHGEEPVDCLHPLLEGILKETYGVIIYQEQVIQIAQVMGGYTLGQADLLRRAMGKKDKAEMAKQQARFVEGAQEKGVKKQDAVYIFELVDKFAGYGFNKSHAAAYALVSYHTAYLKANYREEFLAASMTLDMANTDKLSMFAGEARRAGIEVLPPCVNESFVDFDAIPGADGKPGAIRYSLAALKNIGPAAVQTVIDEREANGAFKDLSEFARRLNPKTLNKRGLEMLAAAGAFDAFEASRSRVYANVEQIMALASRISSDAAVGMSDLFGGGGAGNAPAATLDLRPAKVWTPMERLDEEFKAI